MDREYQTRREGDEFGADDIPMVYRSTISPSP